MSGWWSYAGGLTLAAATIPQAIRLLRTRDVGGFGWAFAWMNFAGISLLAARAWEIGEAGFLVCNLVTATFWALVLALKGAAARAPLPTTGPA